MEPKERLNEAKDAAIFAFWEEVAKRFSEIKTGDFPPEMHVDFDERAEKYIAYWAGSNGGIFPCFPNEYSEEHWCGECGEKKVPAGVKLCKDCMRESIEKEMEG